MRIETELAIAADHPAFAGHFPGQPIVPGVVLLDETLHAIAAHGGITFDRCTLVSVKFKSVVRPGQPLKLSFVFVGPNSVRFELSSAAQAVASGAVSITIAREVARAR